MTEADIIINSLHSFATLDSAIDPNKEQSSCSGTIDPSSCDGHYDLENVITHEIGHFHGLGEDYDDNQASMFSCTSACESHKRSLNDSDISAINQLYSGMQLEAHNTGECAWIPERGPQTPGKAACIFLVLAALLRRARRRS